MARNRRRLGRISAPKSSAPSVPSTRSNSPLEIDVVESVDVTGAVVETCPACTDSGTEALNAPDKESWIRCDACKRWYHWRCAGDDRDVESIDKWYCKPCLEADSARSITIKAPARKSSRRRVQRDYANLNSGQTFDPHRWLKMLEGKAIKEDPFQHMFGSSICPSWLEQDESAMTEPVVIEKPDGLGMKMPPKDFTVRNIVELVGAETPIEVIDVATQSTSPGWTLSKWAEYYMLDPTLREKILNVISLEISGTPLADMILPPRIVSDLDWVENFWPATRKGKGHVYPKVQLYCLMGVASAWTDWHIDFAGSSVYYHVVHGSKIFYFIRPTLSNLAAYERWSGTELQNHAWLGDMVEEVFKVELTEGNTMIIPTGWIHAVHTPVDTLVFGGNFLHSYNVSTQFKVRNIEIATQVPKKFRFPMFTRLCWYVGDKYLRDLKATSRASFPPRIISSIVALAEFLVSEARTLEKGTEQSKKEARDQIPSERIKDAAAMARELRWRAKIMAFGSASDEEGLRDSNGVIGGKRKRSTESPRVDDSPFFKNFKPKKWDYSLERTLEDENRMIRLERPEGTDWKERWSERMNLDDIAANDDTPVAEVAHHRDILVRVRKTSRGFERQRIERMVEEFVWENRAD
ncbi:hypothetical protein AX17_004276 [Amanita inopinata Kibby_2008]|nr:hypothetical protein AX17_004276 [Amanita inopinata Kibby_2008]